MSWTCASCSSPPSSGRKAAPMSAPKSLLRAQHDAGADGGLDEGIGALLIDGIGGPVAGAVGRGDDGGFQRDQGVNHPSNAIMKEARPEMKATDHRMHLLDAGDRLGVMHGVDDT